MKNLIRLAVIALAPLALSGCFRFVGNDEVAVNKTEYEKLVKEHGDYKAKYEGMLMKPAGLTESQCKAVAEVSAKLVSESVSKSVEDKCTAKPAPAAPKRVVAKRTATSGASATATARATGAGASATATASTGGTSALSANPAQASAQPGPAPTSGKFWGWVHPEATVANKKTCYADRQITGLPAQCSSMEVFSRQGTETEEQWNARVAAKNGIVVGQKDTHGTITGTQFGRVQVK
jgi:hypothetical protein